MGSDFFKLIIYKNKKLKKKIILKHEAYSLQKS